jgi:hypothetical protein
MAQSETAELAQQIASMAATHVSTSKQFFDLDLDYSPQSLQLIDHAITKYHGNQAALESTIATYGAYIGETVRRALGGTWKENDAGPALHDVGGSATVFPFSWAHKRFHNGEGDLIAFKYEALLKVLNRSSEAPPKLKIAAEPVEATVLPDEQPAAAANAKPEATDAEVLERSPLLAFLMVAAADGNVDKKEMAKFQQLVMSAAGKSPLFGKVVAGMVPKLGEHAQKLVELGPIGWSLELMRLSKILDEKHNADAKSYKQALYDIAKQVAESSGGGWFGFGKKIGEGEKAALDLLETFLQLKEE